MTDDRRTTRANRPKKARAKEPEVVVLHEPFAGIARGARMFVATPKIIERYIRSIPYGETRSVSRMRNEIARRRRCDACCPVSTAIFIRMVATDAIRVMDAGGQPSDVAPFWRLLSSDEKIARKLDIDGAWIEERRQFEARGVCA